MAFIKSTRLPNNVPVEFHLVSQVDFPSWNRVSPDGKSWLTPGQIVIDRYFDKASFLAGAPKVDSVTVTIPGWTFAGLNISSNRNFLDDLYHLLPNLLPFRTKTKPTQRCILSGLGL